METRIFPTSIVIHRHIIDSPVAMPTLASVRFRLQPPPPLLMRSSNKETHQIVPATPVGIENRLIYPSPSSPPSFYLLSIHPAS